MFDLAPRPDTRPARARTCAHELRRLSASAGRLAGFEAAAPIVLRTPESAAAQGGGLKVPQRHQERLHDVRYHKNSECWLGRWRWWLGGRWCAAVRIAVTRPCTPRRLWPTPPPGVDLVNHLHVRDCAAATQLFLQGCALYCGGACSSQLTRLARSRTHASAPLCFKGALTQGGGSTRSAQDQG